MSRWVLPVPESPSSTSGSPSSIQAPAARWPRVAGGEVGDAGEVEVGEPFDARELGLVDPPDPAAGVAVVAFGGQHLGEERLVGQPLLGRGVGQLRGLGADGGQLQGLGRRRAIAASAAGSAAR